MSSGTIVELITESSGLEDSFDTLHEYNHKGTEEAYTELPGAHLAVHSTLSNYSTKPITPKSNSEKVVHTPSTSPDLEEAESNLYSAVGEGSPAIDPSSSQKLLSEGTETENREIRDLDIVHETRGEIHQVTEANSEPVPILEETAYSEAAFSSLQTPKRSKKAKRKETKKKTKKGIAEVIPESEALTQTPQGQQEEVEREDPSTSSISENIIIQNRFDTSGDVAESAGQYLSQTVKEAPLLEDFDRVIEGPAQAGHDTFQTRQELDPQVDHNRPVHVPENSGDNQFPEHIEFRQGGGFASATPKAPDHSVLPTTEDFELQEDARAIVQAKEEDDLETPSIRKGIKSQEESNAAIQLQEIGHISYLAGEAIKPQQDTEPIFQVQKEDQLDPSSILEEDELHQQVEVRQPRETQHAPFIIEELPINTLGPKLEEIELVQQENINSELVEPSPGPEPILEHNLGPELNALLTKPEYIEREPVRNEATISEDNLDTNPESLLPGPNALIIKPEITQAIVEEVLRIPTPDPENPVPESVQGLTCDIGFLEPQVSVSISHFALDPERPTSSPSIEDVPESEASSREIYNPVPNPQSAIEAVSNTITMALQDRSLITSQLSDALALFTSFDESIKTLVTRLQSTESNLLSKPKQEGSVPTSSAAFHVPFPRNEHFLGRFSNLSQIFGMWRPHQRCRIAVVGLGGLGKTELLIEFVYRAKQVSPNTPIFWFGPNDVRSKDTSASASAGMQLEDWLRGLHDPGSLVVVDCGDRSDLFEITSERGSFIDHLRKFEGTVILVSRNARHGSLIARPHEICEVKELDLDSCVTLMCHNLEPYAHDASNEREMEEVVKSLSCIPRAIIQITKVINSTQMTVSQFQEMYSTGEAFQLRLFGKIDGYSRPDHNLSVIGKGVFDLRSFRKMHAEPSRLLYQVYYLGGRSVPCALVATEDPLNKILLMLIVKAHYMIIEDESTQTFSIHPMVYLAMRKALGGERPLSDESDILEERKWYDEAVLAFSKHYPDANCESRAWWKDSFTHLISGYNLHSDTQRVAIATIYHRESSFFKRKGIFSEALKMASLAKSVLPEPIPSECLAILQDQVTLLDFLAKYREVHEILRGVTMEVGHPGNLWKKSMMARLEVADCANRYDSAIEIYRQVRTAGEASNADKLYLANATDDLSMALMQKGKYREAVMECRKALAERSTRLGSSHTDTLSSYHNLAEILYKDGKFEEALKYIQEALRGRDSALGPEHPETMYSKVMRARIQISKATMASEFDEAEAVLLHCIDRLGSKLSPSHPIVLTCKSEIARIMFSRGNYETAEQMNQSVLAAREQGPWLEPTTHPDTMTSRNQLSEVIRLKDGSKAADNLSERCLTERTVVLTNGSLTGDDFHPDQLASLHNRAIILSALGQHLAALQKIDLALLGRKCILGEYHPDYFLSMTWKGEIMRAQLHRYQSERTQTLDTIENLHKQAYEGLSWILGSEHQSSLQCATHMGLAKRERGSPASSEAEGLFRQIHCAYQHNMGDFHPETLKSKGRLAEAMRAASPRHHLEAKKLWRDSCGGLTKCYGFDAYVTANAYKGYEKFLRTYPDP